MDIIVIPLLGLILKVLNIYVFLLLVWVILSWLVAFNVVNTQNAFVHMVGTFLDRITAPVLYPIRKILPPMGGLDLSPLILILLVYFLQDVIEGIVLKLS